VPGPIPELTIGAIAGQVHAEMAAASLKQSLEQLGIKSRVVAEPAAAIFARSHDEKQMFDVLFMAETRLPPDPDPWIGARFGCKAAGRTNYSWYCSEAVDALVAEARRSSDPGLRWSNFKAAATLIEADAAELWIGTAVRLGIFRSGISGLLFSPLNEGLDLRWTSIDRRTPKLAPKQAPTPKSLEVAEQTGLLGARATFVRGFEPRARNPVCKLLSGFEVLANWDHMNLLLS
jgi:ABC-type transport system substrate-binding protein